jgi:hypothetical protein
MSDDQPTIEVALGHPEEIAGTQPRGYAPPGPVTRAVAAERQPGLFPEEAIRNGALPSHAREVLYWKITQNRWQVIVVNVLSLPLAALMGLVFFGWLGILSPVPGTLRLQLLQVVSVIPAMVVTLILHEGAHGLAMLAYSARPRFGILWQGLMLYATSPGYAFRRNAYAVVILAPLISLSLLALLAMPFLPFYLGLLVALCATVNGAGAIGDLWILLIALRYPPQAYIMDERDGMRIFMPGA